MVNSLFMLGSSYNKNKMVSIVFMIGWIAFMLIRQFCFDMTFPVINTVVFLAVTIGINLIKNKKANTILSIFSILIWSVAIDIICYYMYPIYSSSLNIFEYVLQGILFNYKYVFSNVIAVSVIYALDTFIANIKANSNKKILN